MPAQESSPEIYEFFDLIRISITMLDYLQSTSGSINKSLFPPMPDYGFESSEADLSQ